MDELRHAIRRIGRHPGASLASIVTLAAAIGASAAAWSVISAALLHPLPVQEPDGLVVAGTRERTGPFAGRLFQGLIYPEFARLRESGAFEDVAAEWGSAPVLPTSAGGAPVPAKVGFATANYFTLLGIDVRIGRGFQLDEDRRGAAPVAVLPAAYCRRAFDGCVNALGRTLTVAGRTIPVVGVIEPRFRGVDLSQSIDFYLPFHTIGDVASPLMNYFADPGTGTSPTAGTRIIGRLREGDRRRLLGDVELTPIETSAIPAVAHADVTQFARLLVTTVALLLLIAAAPSACSCWCGPRRAARSSRCARRWAPRVCASPRA